MIDQQPHEPPAWNWPDDERGDDAGRRPRRWLLLAAAAVPWTIVAALVLRPGPAPVDAAAPLVSPPPADGGLARPADPAASGPPEPAASTTSPTPRGTAHGEIEATTLASAARHAPDVGDAVTTAILVARSWFTGPGPTSAAADPQLDGGRPGYVEHVWVEAVDAPWSGHLVVTLGVLVLEADGEDLLPRANRLAVPVALDGRGARAAGPPYLLPAPQVVFEPLAFEPVDDPDAALMAVDALVAAGYEVVEVVELSRSEGWPWSIAFEGRAPGGDRTAGHHVWLRPHLDGFVVAGWLPTPPSDPPPAPTEDAPAQHDGPPDEHDDEDEDEEVTP